jgi:hypothetical protein
LYDAPATLFQPGADERCQQGAEGGPGGLREQLVFHLAAVTLRGEYRTDQGAAGPLNLNEPVPGRDTQHKWERGDGEVAEQDFHRVCIT